MENDYISYTGEDGAYRTIPRSLIEKNPEQYPEEAREALKKMLNSRVPTMPIGFTMGKVPEEQLTNDWPEDFDQTDTNDWPEDFDQTDTNDWPEDFDQEKK